VNPFAPMLTAASLSWIGDGVMLAAAPLAAATITTNPQLISGLTVAATLPWALFCLFAGAVADRVDRIRLMRRIDLVRGAVITVPAIAFALGSPSIVLLYVVFFSLGTAETFFSNAAQAALPIVVPEQRLRWANGKMQASEIVLGQLAGPPLGALLFAVGAALPFAADAASFLLSACLLFLIRRPTPVRGSGAIVEPLHKQIGEGLAWLWRHSQLRVLAVFTGLVNLFTEATMAILVLFSIQDLGAGKAGFGYLLAIAAVGGTLAGIVGPTLTNHVDDRLVLVGVLATQSVTQLVIFFSSSFVVVAVSLSCAAFGIVIWNIVTISLRQTLVPEHLLGRVNSVYRLLAWGMLPIGAAAGGALAAMTGIRSVFLVSSLLLGALTIVGVFFLRVSSGRHSEPSETTYNDEMSKA
jgi:MFS family permease